MTDTPNDDIHVLTELRQQLEQTQFPLDLGDVSEVVQLRDAAAEQIGDYILPRLTNLEAPLLVVVGGSTGSGKSTLVNSLVEEVVSASGAIRPTTRQPILLADEPEMAWFRSDRVLPGLRRVDDTNSSLDDALTLRLSSNIPENMALLDAPDIDSVADENRALARKLMDAADLWLFVTTANRYADAAAWTFLNEAGSRGITVGVVLNRVPAGAGQAISADLRRLLDSRNLPSAPIFVMNETVLDDGQLIPTSSVEPIRQWLSSLAADHTKRLEIVRQSLTGAIRQLADNTDRVAAGRKLQEEAGEGFQNVITSEYAAAKHAVMGSATDGSLLRGEVLGRWQDFVGTSDIFRSFESWIGGFRDRVNGWFKGTPAPVHDIETEIASGLAAVLVDEAGKAAAQTWRQLRKTNAGRQLFTDESLGRESPSTSAEAVTLVREWQDDLLELIRQESPGKRQKARIVSLGVNTVAITLMILVFASTGGLLGGEIAIAGGSAVLGQKLLETIFGDQAVRKLTREGENLLRARIDTFFAGQMERYFAVLAPVFESASSSELINSAVQLREVP